jgi:hypothetical protein
MLPPNMQFLQRRQKEIMMASLNGRQPQQQMMGGILPMGSHLPPSMQLDPNFQNFSPNLRNRNWNEFEHGMGNGGTCVDRRGSFPINGRGREGQFDGRQHVYDRDNHRDFGSNHRDFGNNGGRMRRDSEAEWEEWERTRMEDEYAGLMTPKQKSWLRNIQTMQLTTDNPYRDDYYFVVSTTYLVLCQLQQAFAIFVDRLMIPVCLLASDNTKDVKVFHPAFVADVRGKEVTRSPRCTSTDPRFEGPASRHRSGPG